MYEAAAAAGSSRALNGLGYEYFFGHVLRKDAARAYGYFAEAARLGEVAPPHVTSSGTNRAS